MVSSANASPTKEFFINMLTRDIELNDAILDLLDNCLDGVVRSKGFEDKRTNPEYYKGYEAHINITSESFSILDNCGGIPRDVAEKYAFRMGRTPDTDTKSPTVGIYGIGMKRAIFKIGKTAKVTTKNRDQAYCVIIDESWAKDEADWSFPINELPNNVIESNGTHILITDLNEGIQSQWNTELDYFIDNLTSAIKASYSLIIEKGFRITINELNIPALPTQLLISKDSEFKPYIYQNEYDDVSVKMTVGFYSPLISDDEIDEENESRRSSGDAGYTIVCNDRVILYNDKTHLTGWGEAGIPRYHTQFIGIKGIVIFESNSPENLPMTTTKRGIDLSSPIYADVKNKMREALKLFTGYTNSWKGRLEQEKHYSNKAEPVSYTKILDNDFIEKNYGVNLRNSSGAKVFKPSLPQPNIEKKYLIIRYSKPVDDINLLKKHFFEEVSSEIKASLVGEKCFDEILNEVKGDKNE